MESAGGPGGVCAGQCGQRGRVLALGRRAGGWWSKWVPQAPCKAVRGPRQHNLLALTAVVVLSPGMALSTPAYFRAPVCSFARIAACFSLWHTEGRRSPLPRRLWRRQSRSLNQSTTLKARAPRVCGQPLSWVQLCWAPQRTCGPSDAAELSGPHLCVAPVFVVWNDVAFQLCLYAPWAPNHLVS